MRIIVNDHIMELIVVSDTTLFSEVCSVTAADTRFLLIGWTLEMDTVKHLRGSEK